MAEFDLKISLLLLSLFVFDTFVGIHGDAQLIQDTCSKTSDPKFCMATLGSDKTSLAAANLTGVQQSSLIIASNGVDALSSTIQELLRNQSIDQFTKGFLEDCQNSYDDASYNILSATDALRANNYQNVEGQLQGVLKITQDCEASFSKKPGTISPLTKQNEQQIKLLTLSLDVLKMLAKKQ